MKEIAKKKMEEKIVPDGLKKMGENHSGKQTTCTSRGEKIRKESKIIL